MKIVITGPPKSGKSTLAKALGRIFPYTLQKTDNLLEREMQWGEMSEHVSHWFDAEGDWIIEGVTVPRALRKWKERNPLHTHPPFDRFVFLRHSHVAYTLPGQRVMATQIINLSEVLRPWIGDHRWVEL